MIGPSRHLPVEACRSGLVVGRCADVVVAVAVEAVAVAVVVAVVGLGLVAVVAVLGIHHPLAALMRQGLVQTVLGLFV